MTSFTVAADREWYDKEIRFDVAVEQLELRRGGEFVIDCMSSIEDTKGNNGESGELRVFCADQFPHGVALEYVRAAVNINIRETQSRLCGRTQALYVLTKFNGSRFEFIFTQLARDSTRLFSTVQSVFRAYDTSKMYRELKLRGAVMKDKELVVLPQERVFNKLPGVWNLSADQGNLGTLFLTNVRVVWHANLAENFNVSIPFIQMNSVRIRESKFGPAMVIHTTKRSGQYCLGFRIDPPEKLAAVLKEVGALFMTYTSDPVYGVEFEIEKKKDEEDVKPPRQLDDGYCVDDDPEANRDVLAAYYADGTKAFDREPELNEYLGLAAETLPDGVTMAQLWSAL